ncbi:MAG: SoxR reducing system RseC family protein [Bacteroidaceae bacterium]|nr:SoxR reducing system RseC family protein [Bacteroidaceae bacterium]
MAQDIRHDGVVDSIDGQNVIVRITQSSACGGCQARNICRAAESKDKLVEVHCADAGSFDVGQTVTVAGAESLGMKAVAFAFGLPLLLLLVALITAMSVTGSERVAAIAALGILVPYYIVLFLFRGRIKKDFQFRIIE